LQTALNDTLANYNGTLTAAAFQTAEGSDIFLFTVDNPSSAAYFAIPEGSSVALSPVTAAVVDVTDEISTCNVCSVYPQDWAQCILLQSFLSAENQVLRAALFTSINGCFICVAGQHISHQHGSSAR
jgi:hypothetical protein